MRFTRGIRVAAGVLAAILLVGCGAPETGWRRLWSEEWTQHNSGERWVLGVPAAGRDFSSEGRGQELRMELLNRGEASATVRLVGAGGEVEWSLAVGESRPIEIRPGRGRHRIESPPEVVLGSPRLGRPQAESRLLVVVLVDTLRADHVNPELMPGVVEGFSRGRRWRNAIANSSWTLPSVASFFTARPVLELSSAEGEMIGVPESVATWATRLHGAGFEGGAVVANYTVHALNGFASGFSSFQVPDGRGSSAAPDGEWVTGEARRWLASHRGEDGFLYLHLMDPHEPYRSHSGVPMSVPPLRPLARHQREATAEESRLLRDLYAGEVRHVDGVVARFLSELPESAEVVLTSDHGEALGEHGAWAHGLNLYQEAIAVPLMMRGPSIAAGEVFAPVQLLDLGPTLLEICGVEPEEGMSGRSLLSGGSTEPMVSATFSAGPLRWAWREGDHKVVMRMAAQPDLGAVGRRDFVAARPLPTGSFHLDLAADPGEDRPGSIPTELMDRVGAAFAETAGRMVPGMQLLLWGGEGAATTALEVDGVLDVVQAWSPSAIEVSQSNGRFEVRCVDTDPVCAVALAPDSVPAMVTVIEGDPHRLGLAPGQRVDPRTLDPPTAPGRGPALWWNPERALIVGGYEETLERLRALGYID